MSKIHSAKDICDVTFPMPYRQQQRAIAALKQIHRERTITNNEAATLLAKLGLTPKYARHRVNNWAIQRTRQERRP